MNKFKLLLAAGLFALAGSVSAVPIEGSIIFGGQVSNLDTTLNTVAISGNVAGVTGGIVAGDTFSNEGIVTFSSTAVYNNFTYDPLSVTNPLWSLAGDNGDFKFDLQQITLIDESGTNSRLQLEGIGMLSYTGTTPTGFDDTLYNWSFSVDSTGVFGFSATNTPAPEPSIALLLGIGLIGFGVTRKVRKSA